MIEKIHPSSTNSPLPAPTSSPEGRGRWEQNPVVASLPKRATHGYNAISLSPSGDHAVLACYDTIQIVSLKPHGLEIVRTIPFAPHAASNATTSSVTVATAGNSASTPTASAATYRSSRPATNFHPRPLRISEDFFEEPGRSTSRSSPLDGSLSGSNSIAMMNILVNDVAWSKNLFEVVSNHHHQNTRKQQPVVSTQNNPHQQESFIAAAGSNGSIVVWREETLLRQIEGKQQNGGQQPKSYAPEVVLSQHIRAVNRLAWHPKRQMLLSASHDSTVRLWERKKVKPDNDRNHRHTGFNFPFFGDFQGNNKRGKDGEITSSYTWQCTGVFEPKAESVRDIGWNPISDDVFALSTSNGCLIVYNRFVRARTMLKINAHDRDATTLDWHPTLPFTIATGGSNDRVVKVWNLENSLAMDQQNMDNAAINVVNNQNTQSSTKTDISDVSTDSSVSVGSKASTAALTFCSTSSYSRQPPEYVLAVAAPVKRVRWRPPSTVGQDQFSRTLGIKVDEIGTPSSRNVHESMLAVATVPVKGESGGGCGFVALWSYFRPYIPISVIEGHQEGAVTDLAWLDSPRVAQHIDAAESRSSVDEIGSARKGLWQHVLSVGKDGQCLVQSLAKGERPITNVPPSCFAMANLSPFQRGYGSLQIFSVSQDVQRESDYWLRVETDKTSTAKDAGRASSSSAASNTANGILEKENNAGEQFDEKCPSICPTITFYSVDQGELDPSGKPTTLEPTNGAGQQTVIAPEVVHMSRFADKYVFYPTSELPRRTDICRHNFDIATSLQNSYVARMWQTVLQELERSGADTLQDVGDNPTNDIRPIIRGLLEERADGGDVQSCVAVCEVLQIVNADRTTKIPGLVIQIVREWYISYIDLLRGMCLFAHASDIIRNCNDPFVAAQNKHSTSIAESCQGCGKPVLADRRSVDQNHQVGSARLLCKDCKRTIGNCSICQLPVTGMVVWCPGCGHGGHMEHIMSWFSVQQECPTGCGHHCNMLQTLNAFPRSSSMRDLDKLDICLNSS